MTLGLDMMQVWSRGGHVPLRIEGNETLVLHRVGAGSPSGGPQVCTARVSAYTPPRRTQPSFSGPSICTEDRRNPTRCGTNRMERKRRFGLNMKAGPDLEFVRHGFGLLLLPLSRLLFEVWGLGFGVWGLGLLFTGRMRGRPARAGIQFRNKG